MEATGGGPPGEAPREPRSIFRFPWVASFLLAWTVGAVDSVTYERFGVFTSNQAGNLVIIATDAAARRHTGDYLPGLSLAGAAIGVTVGVWLAHAFGPSPSRKVVAPMVLATALILASLGIDFVGLSEYLLIPTISAGLAALAAAVLHVPSVGTWITANTGQVLSAVSGLTGPRPEPGWWRGIPRPGRNAIVLTGGFVMGALLVGSGVVSAKTVMFGLVPVCLVVGTALVRAVADKR